MATLPETGDYPIGIYQIETSDPVQGGVTGITNKPLTDLANRTKNLKTRLDDHEIAIADSDATDPHFPAGYAKKHILEKHMQATLNVDTDPHLNMNYLNASHLEDHNTNTTAHANMDWVTTATIETHISDPNNPHEAANYLNTYQFIDHTNSYGDPHANALYAKKADLLDMTSHTKDTYNLASTDRLGHTRLAKDFEVIDGSNNAIAVTPYGLAKAGFIKTLPQADIDKLGVVQVGAGLSITQQGVLSANSQRIDYPIPNTVSVTTKAGETTVDIYSVIHGYDITTAPIRLLWLQYGYMNTAGNATAAWSILNANSSQLIAGRLLSAITMFGATGTVCIPVPSGGAKLHIGIAANTSIDVQIICAY